MQYKTDVVIVGAGIAGLTTALDLMDSSKKIMVLDRNGPERLGGLAVDSFGGIFFVGSPQQKRLGIADSSELALQDWIRFGELEESQILERKWAETYVYTNYEKVYLWLKKAGVGYFPVVHWVERGLYQPGNSVPRFHMVWGTGSGLMDSLIRKIKQHPNASNLTIKYHHRVDVLQKRGSHIAGVDGEDEAHKAGFHCQADQVVLAAGGFSGNTDEVAKNWYSRKVPKIILNGTHPSADGKLHHAACAVGGRTVNMNKMWLYAAGVHHPRPEFDLHGLSLVPPRSALWVDACGKRIGPQPLMTSFDTRYLVQQTTSLPDSHTWLILNRKIAVKELAVSGSQFNDAIRDRKLLAFLKTVLFGNVSLVDDLVQNCEDFVIADNLDALVAKMTERSGQKVDGELLKNDIERYDGQIQRGVKYHNDDQLRRLAHLRQYRGDRVRTCKFQAILDSKAMPLMAIRVFPLSRKCLGGIQTDLQSRVLDQYGEPLSGLYAVGETAGFGGGGIHGMRALEGTFLGSCILTGRHAAESILKS
ncbi:MAG: FAD-binding dehydrogenase [Acidobacteria bacterium]|nr:MAG: FAD-binding dehydrogenase [Acidobacteriota bacterium]